MDLFSKLRIILYNLERTLKPKQISLLTTRCLRHKATAFNDSSHNERTHKATTVMTFQRVFQNLKICRSHYHVY